MCALLDSAKSTCLETRDTESSSSKVMVIGTGLLPAFYIHHTHVLVSVEMSSMQTRPLALTGVYLTVNTSQGKMQLALRRSRVASFPGRSIAWERRSIAKEWRLDLQSKAEVAGNPGVYIDSWDSHTPKYDEIWDQLGCSIGRWPASLGHYPTSWLQQRGDLPWLKIQ